MLEHPIAEIRAHTHARVNLHYYQMNTKFIFGLKTIENNEEAKERLKTNIQFRKKNVLLDFHPQLAENFFFFN